MSASTSRARKCACTEIHAPRDVMPISLWSKPRRAARRERVAEPVAVLGRELVGDVGERAGALVGRDHEVGVVAVVAHDVRAAARPRPSTRLSVSSSSPRMKRLVARALSSRRASRTNPPFAPTGTMTAFFTVCAFISPRTSVRKSSRRSDQRMPPRAMSPARRCTPSTDGDATQISCCGCGWGRKSSAVGSNLHARCASPRYAFVRTVARTTCHERAQDAVGVEAGDRVDRAPELGVEARLERAGRVVSAAGSRRGVEPRDEQPHRVGVVVQRVGEVRVGEAHAGLAQVLAQRAHDHDVARPRARRASTSRLSPSFSIVPAHTPRNTSATRACVAGSASGSPAAATHTERVDPPRCRRARRSRTGARRPR